MNKLESQGSDSLATNEQSSCCSVSSCCGPKTPIVRTSAKIGRNDPCPCGNGRKYKKCCGTNA
jgi:uncharacterized protein YecA (UPF0149 family)